MRTEDELTADDQQARHEALDVTRSFIVQAPAGSGKTELLIQRYLRLLATVDNPEEILAITFTRKAAREMQQRVSQALLRAQTGVAAELEHEQRTLDAALAVLNKDEENDWQLLKSPRRMRIQTLDALCAGITRLVPLSSGIGGVGNTIVSAEVKINYESAAVATLDWLLVDDGLNAAVEKVLSHLDNSTVAYVAYVSRMLETRDQWLGITGTGLMEDPTAVRKLLEKNIAIVVQHHLRASRKALELADTGELPALASYAGTNLCENGMNDHVAAVLSELSSIPGSDLYDLPLWGGVAELLLTKKGTWRKTVTKNDGFPAGDAGQKKAWLKIIGDLSGNTQLLRLLSDIRMLPAPSYDDSQWDVLLALLRLLPAGSD